MLNRISKPKGCDDYFYTRKERCIMYDDIRRGLETWEDWYYCKATPEEQEIYDLIFRYSNYFNDLTIQRDSITYTMYETNVDNLSQTFYNNLIVRVREIGDPDLLAYYDSQYHIVTVSPKAKTEEYCILHEMIHMFDKQYDYLVGLRDAVAWRLYYDLQKKINGLDKAILDFTKIKSLMSINRCPENPRVFKGGHDTLFLLKSFDLDMKMNYPFGTVLGYGYTDKFKYLEKY